MASGGDQDPLSGASDDEETLNSVSQDTAAGTNAQYSSPASDRGLFVDSSTNQDADGDAVSSSAPQHFAGNTDQAGSSFEDYLSGRSTRPVLGLRLDKTPEFIDQINKALNFHCLQASLIKIGNWEKRASDEQTSDLVGTFCFGTQQMVWEFKENAINRKIEIEWGNIISMRSINQEAIFEIELNKTPPKFYIEYSQMGAAKWQQTEDFTNGEAQKCRIHSIKFVEAIDETMEKLIQSDTRFLVMTQKGFPSAGPSASTDHHPPAAGAGH